MSYARKYPDAKARSRAEAMRRRARERDERKAWFARLATPAPALTAVEAVQLYHEEKAIAMQRWADQGGPSCGFTSGRHPVCYGRGYPG